MASTAPSHRKMAAMRWDRAREICEKPFPHEPNEAEMSHMPICRMMFSNSEEALIPQLLHFVEVARQANLLEQL